MKKILIPLFVVLALVASGCGDDDDTEIGEQPADDGEVVEGSDETGDDMTGDDDAGDDIAADDSADAEPPLGAGPYPIADLVVTFQLDESDDPTTYQLACLGDTATVTGEGAPADAETLCLALDDEPIRDRLVIGPADDLCTMEYGGPETATITGTLDDTAVDASFDRADGCGISDWALFSSFLPAAP